MSYEVLFSRRVDKALDRLSGGYSEPHRGRSGHPRRGDPRPQGSRKMQGQRGSDEDRRLRVGDYRVVYGIEEPGAGDSAGLVTVLAIGHRQGIYG